MTTPSTHGEQRSPDDTPTMQRGRPTSAVARSALPMVTSAALAAAAVVGVLFATGAVHTGGATQSVAVPPTSGPAPGPSGNPVKPPARGPGADCGRL